MKARLRDVRGAAYTTASVPPLIITLYQSASRLAIFLSVSFPSFSLWNLSIPHLSLLLLPLILHSSHHHSFRQQPSSPQQAACYVFLFFWDGWGLTESYGSFRSSHLRRPGHAPEEPGCCLCTHAHMPTCPASAFSLQASRSDSSLFTPVGPVAWINVCNNRTSFCSCRWWGRHNDGWK